ncbi:FAD-binding oxidoreductase [Lysobacter sp. TY2-98]|uniref:NAD(P)/FAD-dependent oxidoreductase n=1 Tax=Lysobacter sp. TY2-98 TaxID=2290922 RepID=UPI000E206E32|nr:FAD-binding oxidoreductase [Lysobacter sp. TY2-98]AXK71717.1 FAD-binding oxidoreductase [Lysobacter sp. TY2-98]
MPRFQGDYYSASAGPPPAARPLAREIDCDVCVVGGGFAGLNTALGLLERGRNDLVLLESQHIGYGASGRNGGFVFGGYSRDEDRLLADLGPDVAREVYGWTNEAVRRIRDRIDHYGVHCDVVDGGVIWANWFDDPTPLATRQALLAQRYGVDWVWLDREEMRRRVVSERYADGLFEAAAFHFHPLRYARGLAGVLEDGGARVHEGTPAVALDRDGDRWRVRTPGGAVRARTVVLACGGYLAKLRRRVDAAVLPIATYVMVTEPLGDRLHEVLRTPAAVYDTRFAFDYYRPLPDTRLLWGGRISVLDRSPVEVEKLLVADMLRVFPQLQGVAIDHAWSGLMSYAPHEMPHVLQAEPGLWVAQAFGGHGVAPTTAAGDLVASAIAEGDTRWQLLSRYGLMPAFKPAGFLGAQLGYWWASAKDAAKEWGERRRG